MTWVNMNEVGPPSPHIKPVLGDIYKHSGGFQDMPKHSPIKIDQGEPLDSDKVVEQGYRYTGPNPTKPTSLRIGEYIYRGFNCYQEPQHMHYIVEENGKEAPIGRFNRKAIMEDAINKYIDKREFLKIKMEFYDEREERTADVVQGVSR